MSDQTISNNPAFLEICTPSLSSENTHSYKNTHTYIHVCRYTHTCALVLAHGSTCSTCVYIIVPSLELKCVNNHMTDREHVAYRLCMEIAMRALCHGYYDGYHDNVMFELNLRGVCTCMYSRMWQSRVEIERCSDVLMIAFIHID